ncbi:MAG: hypothetical protein M3O30_03275 [Planctomycetota bacterium]|nr:hypothetical protein [Planctomycetota bacterium]
MEPQGYSDATVETIREPFLVLDGRLRVKLAGRSFYETFKATSEHTLGRYLYEFGNGQRNIPALRKLLDEALTTRGDFDNYQVEHDFPNIGRRTMLLNVPAPRALRIAHK